MTSFDSARAYLEGPDLFPRYRAPEQGVDLGAAGLSDEDYLQIVERGGAQRALVVRQMSYHHLAEGALAGEPFAVAF